MWIATIKYVLVTKIMWILQMKYLFFGWFWSWFCSWIMVVFSFWQPVYQYHYVPIQNPAPAPVVTAPAPTSTNNAPKISAENFKEISLNSSFDPLDNVTANDSEDGVLTSKIQIVKNTVNVSTAGLFLVEYKVVDSKGASSTAKTIVLVNDGTYKAGNSKIIQANDFEIKAKDVINTDTAIRNAASVKVFNKSNGENITSSVNVNVDKGTYTNSAGNYNITFKVENDSLATISVNANVLGGELPVITHNGFTELNSTLYLQFYNLNKGTTATDTEDGDITNKVITKVNGTIRNTLNLRNPGLYTVTYEVTDLDGNFTKETRIVLVNDGSYVVGEELIIAKANNFIIYFENVDTSAASIKKESDLKVFNKFTGADVTDSENVEVTFGNPEYSSALGIYEITFNFESDPNLVKTISARVTDFNINYSSSAPKIYFSDPKIIALGESIDLLSDVYAFDKEDGDLTDKITVNQSSFNPNKPGIYTISYSVKDRSGNVETRVRIIEVFDPSKINAKP